MGVCHGSSGPCQVCVHFDDSDITVGASSSRSEEKYAGPKGLLEVVSSLPRSEPLSTDAADPDGGLIDDGREVNEQLGLAPCVASIRFVETDASVDGSPAPPRLPPSPTHSITRGAASSVSGTSPEGAPQAFGPPESGTSTDAAGKASAAAAAAMAAAALDGKDGEITSSSAIRAFARAATDFMISTHSVGQAELQWLNFLLVAMWPYLRKAITRRAQREMVERAARELNNHPELQLIELSVEFDPGEVPPVVFGLRTYRRTHKEICAGVDHDDLNGLQIDIDFLWKTQDFRMQPKIKAIGPAGVRINIDSVCVTNIEVNTTMSVVMSPLIDEEPCFGAVQVFFLDLPDITLTLDGLGRFPLLKRMLVSMIQKMSVSVLSETYVLPHRMVIKAKPDLGLETLVTLKSPFPIGLLEIEVMQGRNLKACDTNILSKATSDPYVIVRIGEAEMRTSTIGATTSPAWKDGPDYLPVYNLAQTVKMFVFDDDLLTEDDLIGWSQHMTVFDLYKAAGTTDGSWLPLSFSQSGKVIEAGQLRVRSRFLTLETLAKTAAEFEAVSERATQANAPRLLTVEILGLEGEATSKFVGATCSVRYEPGKLPASLDGQTEANKPFFSMFGGGGGGGESSSKKSGRSLLGRAKSAAGLGYAKRQRGMKYHARTGKAKLWAKALLTNSGKSLALPPEVVRAIEQLRYREKWADEKIAGMFGISVDTVKAAAELRANFEVVWHQSVHFCQFPNEQVFAGHIDVSVNFTKKFRPTKQADLMVDRHAGKITDSTLTHASTDSTGHVGLVRLNLDSEPIPPDTRWTRRVRARLRRKDIVREEGNVDTSMFSGEHQCDANIGDVVPGCLIEFVVQLRPTKVGEPEAFIEDGQDVTRINDHLAPEYTPGVHIITTGASKGSDS